MDSKIYDYVSSYRPFASTPGGQCCTDVAPLACGRGGLPEFRRRRCEQVDMLTGQFIGYFLSDRSYMTRPTQSPSFLTNYEDNIVRVSPYFFNQFLQRFAEGKKAGYAHF